MTNIGIWLHNNKLGVIKNDIFISLNHFGTLDVNKVESDAKPRFVAWTWKTVAQKIEEVSPKVWEFKTPLEMLPHCLSIVEDYILYTTEGGDHWVCYDEVKDENKILWKEVPIEIIYQGLYEADVTWRVEALGSYPIKELSHLCTKLSDDHTEIDSFLASISIFVYNRLQDMAT